MAVGNRFLAIRTQTALLSVACCLTWLIGCGSKHQYKTVPVTGKVTVAGQPLSGGLIKFHPIDDGSRPKGESGKQAWAELQPDGTFRLTTYGDFDGAVVGQHRVALPPAPGNDTGVSYHSKYTNPNETDLKLDVTASGTNHFEIDLDPQGSD